MSPNSPGLLVSSHSVVVKFLAFISRSFTITRPVKWYYFISVGVSFDLQPLTEVANVHYCMQKAVSENEHPSELVEVNVLV